MKKVLSLLLLCAMLFSVVACAVPEGPDQETRPAGDQPGETDRYHADPGLPSLWYDGRSLTIMGLSIQERENPARDIVYFEDVQSDTINEAVHDRNIYVEETYGTSIEVAWSTREEMVLEVERAINAGLPNCQVMETGIGYYGTMMENGELMELNSMSQYLDLTQSWWSQNCREAMSLCGSLFVITGDIMIGDKMGTWALTFNRDLITDHNLENPYDLVDSYRWTFDKLYEMAASVSDAEFHEPDDYFGTTWGFCSQVGNSGMMWNGCGNTIIGKNDADQPITNTLTESAYDAMLDVAKLQFDKNVTILQSNIKGATSNFDGIIKIFQTGHSLFFCGSVTMIEWLREYDMDFGVLPMPMADEVQRDYYSAMHGSHSSALAIPKYTVYDQDDYDFIAVVVQALGCESTATLLEAYYDKTLTYRGLRRPEDQRMLDLVFDGRLYNVNMITPFGGALSAEIQGATTEAKVKRLKSYYDSYINSINKHIEDYLAKHGFA